MATIPASFEVDLEVVDGGFDSSHPTTAKLPMELIGNLVGGGLVSLVTNGYYNFGAGGSGYEVVLSDTSNLQSDVSCPIISWSQHRIQFSYQDSLPEWAYLHVVGPDNQVLVSTHRDDLLGSGPVSGGSLEALLWEAPEGLRKGATLIVNSSADMQAPDAFAWLGFGEGYMSTVATGTRLSTHSAGEEMVEVEMIAGSGAGRYVQRDSVGDKIITSMTMLPETMQGGSGFINWDTGRYLNPGDVCWMVSTGVAQYLREEDQGKSVQLKGERIGPTKNLIGTSENSAYIKQDKASGNVEMTAYVEEDSAQTYYGLNDRGLQVDGIKTTFGWQWGMNSQGMHDGFMSTLCVKNEETTVRSPSRNNGTTFPNGLIDATLGNYPRWIKIQDYIGNNDDNAEFISIARQDMLWQVNGDMFVLTDSSDFTASTVLYPLLPQSTGEQWQLKLWTRDAAQIDGMWLHLLSDNFISKVSVQLTTSLGGDA